MKVLRLLTLLLVALPTFAEKAATLPAPTAYVDDYAGVLTGSGKAQVEAVCREIHAKTKAQIFFVTIHSLEGEQISTFANDLFHRWKIGEKKTDRGVLILLAVADHKRRIEVGFGLEPIITDGEAGRIGRAMVPALQAANYDQAAEIGVDDVAKIIADDANVTLDAHQSAIPLPPKPVVTPQAVTNEGVGGVLVVFFLLIAAVPLFIILYAFRRRRRMQYYGANGVYSPNPVAPIVPFIPFDSGPSTGSTFTSDDSSTFTSSDSSSSSDSFGGGGGGDSGGGGADGGW